jgi:SAM-dependent methyltransferase
MLEQKSASAQGPGRARVQAGRAVHHPKEDATTDRILTGRGWTSQVRRDWTQAAAGWERHEASFLYSLAAVDPFLIRVLELEPGHRVLDFACGSGEPTLAIVPLVAPGVVLGLDVSGPMLAIARRRARLRGIHNVRVSAGRHRPCPAPAVRPQRVAFWPDVRGGRSGHAAPSPCIAQARRADRAGGLRVDRTQRALSHPR